MITESIFSFLFEIIKVLINLIPTIELPDGFSLALGSVSNLIDMFSYVLPINTFLICLSVFFVLNNIKLFISIFNFIIRKIPGLG